MAAFKEYADYDALRLGAWADSHREKAARAQILRNDMLQDEKGKKEMSSGVNSLSPGRRQTNQLSTASAWAIVLRWLSRREAQR